MLLQPHQEAQSIKNKKKKKKVHTFFFSCQRKNKRLDILLFDSKNRLRTA